MTTTTTFEDKCNILGDLWITYNGSPDFEDFISYNDLGLPLAYAIAVDIVSSTPRSEALINETWDLLLSARGLEDTGFGDLEEILGFEELEE